MSTAEKDLYKRVKLLGEGSFGKAYLVECVADGSLCVIKQVDLTQMKDEERRETIKEARILEALRHPNIVKFREVYKTKNNRLCIVMDYADGGDLAHKIRDAHQKPMSENNILDWFTQICLAIKHVHDRKIIHRDLKAQNIFLTKDGIIKLGDFGIARVLNHTREKCKTMVGTPYYLSPEIIESRDYSFKTDIWSLGIILYELCTLKPPFNAESLPALAMKIVRGQYNPLPDNYSSNTKNLIKTLLNVDPNKRPTIHELLKMPAIVNRIRSVLSESIRNVEFSHTILHKQNFVNKDLQVPFDDELQRQRNQNQVVSAPILRRPLSFLQQQPPLQNIPLVNHLQRQKQVYQQNQPQQQPPVQPLPYSNYEYFRPNAQPNPHAQYNIPKQQDRQDINRQQDRYSPYQNRPNYNNNYRPSVSPLNDRNPINDRNQPKYDRDISPLLDRNVYMKQEQKPQEQKPQNIRKIEQKLELKQEQPNNFRYEVAPRDAYAKKSPLQRIQDAHSQLQKITEENSQLPEFKQIVADPKPDLRMQQVESRLQQADMKDSHVILKKIRDERKNVQEEQRDKMKRDIQKRRDYAKQFKDKENGEIYNSVDLESIPTEDYPQKMNQQEQKQDRIYTSVTEQNIIEKPQVSAPLGILEPRIYELEDLQQILQNDKQLEKQNKIYKQFQRTWSQQEIICQNEDANRILEELENLVNDIEEVNQSQVIDVDDSDFLQNSEEREDAESLLDDEEAFLERDSNPEEMDSPLFYNQLDLLNHLMGEIPQIDSLQGFYGSPEYNPLVLIYEAMNKLQIKNLQDVQ